MIAVAFASVMPGITFLSEITTRGMELSQSLCRMTFHGNSRLVLFPVRVRSSFLIFVAVMMCLIVASPLTDNILLKDYFCVDLRTKPEVKFSRPAIQNPLRASPRRRG